MTSSTPEDTYRDYCRATTESGIGYSNCVTSGQGLNLSGPVSFSEMKIGNTLQRSQECLQCHTWLFHTTGSMCALLGLTWDQTISPSFLFRETNLSGLVNIQPKGQQREQVLDKVKANRSRYFKSVSLLGLPCIFTWTNCHKEVVETHILQTPFSLWPWARKFMYTSCVWKFHFSLVFWTQYLPGFLISVETYCRGKAATVPYLSLPYVWGKHDAGSLVSVLPTFWTPFTLSPPSPFVPHSMYVCAKNGNHTLIKKMSWVFWVLEHTSRECFNITGAYIHERIPVLTLPLLDPNWHFSKILRWFMETLKFNTFWS